MLVGPRGKELKMLATGQVGSLLDAIFRWLDWHRWHAVERVPQHYNSNSYSLLYLMICLKGISARVYKVRAVRAWNAFQCVPLNLSRHAKCEVVRSVLAGSRGVEG